MASGPNAIMAKIERMLTISVGRAFAVIGIIGLSACMTTSSPSTFILPTTSGDYTVTVIQRGGSALPAPIPALLHRAAVDTMKAGYTHFKTSEPLDINSKKGSIKFSVLGPNDSKQANLDFHVFDAAQTEVQYKGHALPVSTAGLAGIIKAERCPGLTSPVKREIRPAGKCR